jgi:hypothetical protein
MSSDPTYADEDFESIVTEKYKYNENYIITEIRQQEDAHNGHQHAFVTVHEPAGGFFGRFGDLFRTKELRQWSWAVDENGIEDELTDRIEQATEYIDEREADITETENEVRSAFEQTVPESEQKSDYGDPNEYRELVKTRLRESLLSRLLVICLAPVALAVLWTLFRAAERG